MKQKLYNKFRFALLLLLAAPAALFAQQGQPELHQEKITYDTEVAAVGLAYVQVLPDREYTLGLQRSYPFQNLSATDNSADCNPALAAEVVKSFENSYKVGNADILNIENKFGKVHVNTWKKNEIHIKVNIICRAGTEEKAQQMMSLIRVAESRSGNTITYRTELEPMRVNNNNERSFEINYIVSMPAANPLTIKNSFGDVYLADFKGKADINVRYGSLKTGQLSNVANTVKVAYGSANCGYINQGNIELAYGSMNIEGTNGLQGSSKYSDFKIGSLNNVLDLNMKYGSLRVDNISRNVSKINVESGFSPIALRFDDNTAFDFDVNVQFGNFKYDKELVNVTSLEKNHTSAAYKGRFGSSSSKASVNVVSRYGDVRFTR